MKDKRLRTMTSITKELKGKREEERRRKGDKGQREEKRSKTKMVGREQEEREGEDETGRRRNMVGRRERMGGGKECDVSKRLQVLHTLNLSLPHTFFVKVYKYCSQLEVNMTH